MLVVIAGLFVAGCSKDDSVDTIAPTALINSPVEEMVYQRGQSIVLNATFEDNVALSHADVSISSVALKGWNTPWEAIETFEFSGKSQQLSAYELFGEPIPVDIMSGAYRLEILVVDKELNYTRYDIAITIE